MSIRASSVAPLPQALLLISLAAVVHHFFLRPRWKRRALPPGPRGVPILGATMSMLDTSLRPWQRFEQWSKQYRAGPLLYIPTLGQDHVIVNTMQAAYALLEKRAHIYSDRPPMIFPGDIVQGKMVLANIRGDDDAVMRRRKLLNEQFSPRAAVQCQVIQTDEARALVLRLLRDPDSYVEHISRGAQSLVLRLTYSKAITMPDEQLWAHVHYALNRPEPAISPFLNIWPSLARWPAWLPGGGFKRVGRQYYEEDASVWTSLFGDVKADIKRGTNNSSFLSRMIDSNAGERYGLSELELAFAAGNLLSAGGDLPEITIKIFLCAMLHFPAVLAKCQAEIDRIVSRGRLPTFDDKSALPYTRATILETQRWRPLTPIGVAHASTQDDVYEGMFIPRGSSIYPNLWAMSQDQSLYPEPDELRPERHLSPDGQSVTRKLELPTFGFGRRICAAVPVAEATIFIHIVTLLWAFDLVPPIDDAGQRVLPSVDINVWEGMLPCQPPPFACQLIPRDTEAAHLIEADQS